MILRQRRENRNSLFHGYGFCEVARLINVAAAANGNVISEKLQGQDFEDRSEDFGGGRDFDDVVSGFAREARMRTQ